MPGHLAAVEHPSILSSPDVLVIGGGLVGLSAALEIAWRGGRVTVVEKDVVGRHASSLNAGGVRRVNRHVAELPLAQRALALWPDLADRLGADVRFRASGHLLVAENEEEMDRIAARAREANGLGHAHERLVSQAEVREIAPALSHHIVGGLWGAGDGHADPRATVDAYRGTAERAGVAILEGAGLIGLERGSGSWAATTTAGRIEAAIVVNCAGAWGGAVAAMADDPLPVEPRAPMALIVAPRPRFVGPVVQTLTRRLTLKQRDDGAVAIGGGHRALLPSLGEPALVLDEAEANLATAISLFPEALSGARPARVWAGTEGYAPDGMAILGPSARHRGLIYAFAFSGHGFALVPAVGEVIADFSSGRVPGVHVDALSPSRFLTGQGA